MLPTINRILGDMMNAIYDLLSRHQIDESWDFREVIANLHLWRERFNSEFKLEVHEYAIAVDHTRHICLGHFRPGHNGFGLKGEIVISRRHVLENGSPDRWWDVLGTLLHELLHAWQQVHGKAGKRNYHNKQFQNRARDLGLIVEANGVTRYEQESLFVDLLRKHGVDVPLLPEIEAPIAKNKGASKLKLWMCGCRIRVRVAVPEFRAVCEVCNQRFERQS